MNSVTQTTELETNYYHTICIHPTKMHLIGTFHKMNEGDKFVSNESREDINFLIWSKILNCITSKGIIVRALYNNCATNEITRSGYIKVTLGFHVDYYLPSPGDYVRIRNHSSCDGIVFETKYIKNTYVLGHHNLFPNIHFSYKGKYDFNLVDYLLVSGVTVSQNMIYVALKFPTILINYTERPEGDDDLTKESVDFLSQFSEADVEELTSGNKYNKTNFIFINVLDSDYTSRQMLYYSEN
jgi:hypothetical protein